MAVKKVTKKEDNNVVELEKNPTFETDLEAVVNEGEEVSESVKDTQQETEELGIEVDNQAIEDKKVTEKNVKIKLGRDHRCSIGGEFYDLKKGQCYNVPEFVKTVLNNAGILIPL